MIKVLLWDIDGTILDFLAAEKAAIKKCFEIMNLGICTDEMVADYSLINCKYWEMLERGEMTKAEILVCRFREFFEKIGINTAVAEEFNSMYQIRLGDTICYKPNAREMLDKYSGSLVQCAVTNGTVVAQRRKLSASGLDKVFDHIFISEEVGSEKPNRTFFDEVFKVIGRYDSSEVMIIGDSLTSDIRGGNNAGILTCWYNQQHKINDKGETVDYEIDDLAKVVEIIDREMI